MYILIINLYIKEGYLYISYLYVNKICYQTISHYSSHQLTTTIHIGSMYAIYTYVYIFSTRHMHVHILFIHVYMSLEITPYTSVFAYRITYICALYVIYDISDILG